MKSVVTAKICFILLFLFWGCGGSLVELGVHGEPPADGVAVQLLVEGLADMAPVRSITPTHVSKTELGSAPYTLVLEGSSDMGSRVRVDNFSVIDGTGMVVLSPGAWNLTLTARNNNADILVGSTFLRVLGKPSSTSITLTPIAGGTGTVNVTFTLPQSVVKRLDPATSTNKDVTVALYDGSGVVVPNTQQSFTVSANTTNVIITYNANNRQIPAGKYTLKLTSPYTVNNGSTGGQDVTYTLTYEDILYVEGNRPTAATITIPEDMEGNPHNPIWASKMNVNGSATTQNFNQQTQFTPFGETVWLYAHRWDGSDTDSNGNEILVIVWNPVYDAEYYEVELLIHPFTKNSSGPAANGKFTKVITNDMDWDNLKNTEIVFNRQRRKPSFLRFSGNVGDSDYYRTKTYVINCNTNDSFLSVADKPLAKTLFPNRGEAIGKVNASYTITGTDAFDTYGTYIYIPPTGASTTIGKVGLEADCSVLGILLPAFTPQMSLVFRVRAVNRYGYSDWIYWKGGKW